MNTKDIDNVQLDDVHLWDHPKYCDACICYAEWSGAPGVPLTDEELNELNEDTDFIHEELIKYLY